jgi:hypothetical protein
MEILAVSGLVMIVAIRHKGNEVGYLYTRVKSKAIALNLLSTFQNDFLYLMRVQYHISNKDWDLVNKII